MSPRSSGREVERQLERIRAGAVNIYGEDELRERLAESIRAGRPLRVKLGMDPSAPDLHLGHTVVLQKLKCFQELGHTPIFLVGDFTARIGDPSGRKKTRPALELETVRKNAATYVEQVGRILDVERAELRFNSEWMDTMSSADLVRLCSRYTVARLLERDDFSQRLSAGEAVSVHELLYPFVQAHDSVALRADVELGGTDQTFNLLMAREIQRDYGQPPQVVITHPLLVGTDGRDKMSKSLGNTIGITDPPEEIYGKVMSLSDSTMWDYYEKLEFSLGDLEQADWRSNKNDPLGLKRQLAATVVARFHGQQAASAAASHFQRVIQGKQPPHDVPEQEIVAGPGGAGLLAVMVQAGLAASNSEARRLVSQGGVQLNGERVVDPTILLVQGRNYLIKAGRRRFKLVHIVE